MQRFDAGSLLLGVVSLHNFGSGLQPNTLIPLANFEQLKQHVANLLTGAESLELTMSLTTIRTIEEILNNEVTPGEDKVYGPGVVFPALPAGRMQHFSRELPSRVGQEIASKQTFFAKASEKRFLASALELFGADVLAKFPSIVPELENAAKCLVYGQHTASVFHLMRAMETALTAIYTSLHLTLPTALGGKNWGTLLSAMNAELTRRKTAGASSWTNLKPDFFLDIYTSLDAVKNAWRNPTMHVANVYDFPHNEFIFFAVVGTLRRIAQEVDEHGMPHA